MHKHSHLHDEHAPISRGTEMTACDKRARAIEALLVEKGVIHADAIRRLVEDMDARTPAQGARVVARAWIEPAFKARLLADATAAVRELDIDLGTLSTLVAVENTDRIHNVIVCTLCSCYPRGLLGLPPDWYKSLSYRSRVVVEPRSILKEFGLEVEPEVEVRVYDSTADMRYLVVPMRPAGTEDLREEELTDLVTRDSMIGVARARAPGVAT
jgi:nitrile hydratase subunit alpha